MTDSAKSSRDDFEYWLFDMDNALEQFFEILPENVHIKLDFSPYSLDIVEKWILEKYPDIQTMLKPSQRQIIDGAARYVGETFRKSGGGKWDIDLTNQDYVFFGIPILVGLGTKSEAECPLSLVTASADRRTGKYIRGVLEYYLK